MLPGRLRQEDLLVKLDSNEKETAIGAQIKA